MSGAKNIIFFCLGGIVGSAMTYFVMQKKVKTAGDKQISEFLEKFYAENGVVDPEFVEKEESKEPVVDENQAEKLYSARDLGDSAIAYRSFYSGGETVSDTSGVDPAETVGPTEDDTEFFDEVDEEIAEREELIEDGGLVTEENASDIWCEETTKEMNSGKKPKLITSESFDDGYPHFDKVELEYYTVDDVLVDISAEEEIADPERIVGDCLDKYGFRTNDEERVIFVRNFNHGTDYEISKVFGRFYSD